MIRFGKSTGMGTNMSSNGNGNGSGNGNWYTGMGMMIRFPHTSMNVLYYDYDGVTVESVTTTPAVEGRGSWRTSRSTVRLLARNGSFHTDAGWPRTRTTENWKENSFHKTLPLKNTAHVRIY